MWQQAMQGRRAARHRTTLGWVMGRIHTLGRVQSRGLDVELEWVVVGDGIADFSENELEIWYSPQDRFDRFRPASRLLALV